MNDLTAPVRAEAQALVLRKIGGWAQSVQPVSVKIKLHGAAAADADTDYESAAAVLRFWRTYEGPGIVLTARRRWAHVGTVDIPTHLKFEEAADVARFAGLTSEWDVATSRVDDLRSRWPDTRLTEGVFRSIANASETDWAGVIATLEWTDRNNPSGLFVRQIPIPGVDTKWVQQKWSLIRKLSAAGARLSSEPLGELRDIEPMTFTRILDESLRAQIGGLGMFTAPPSELAKLPLTPTTVIICENLANGRIFEDRPGTVVLAGKGYDVVGYAAIPWVRSASILYWGDIDTHGFQILDRFRHHLPAISVLMDASTLMNNATMWVKEDKQTLAILDTLTPAEQALHEALVRGDYGSHVRLEQERIPWAQVVGAFEV